MLCSPPDPVEHCSYCFAPLADFKSRYCLQCRRAPRLSFPRAFVFDPMAPILFLVPPEQLAGFVVYQWIQLDWPVPDAILSLPDDASIALSKAVAPLMCRPWVKLEQIEESGLNLLFVDAISPLDHIRKGVRPALETSPKNIYQLSLGPYGFRDHLD